MNRNPISWTFNGLDGEPFMQVRGYRSECCFQLYEWRRGTKGCEEVAGWYPMECYPWDIEQAIVKVRRYMLERQGGETADVRRMVRAMKCVDASLGRTIMAAK